MKNKTWEARVYEHAVSEALTTWGAGWNVLSTEQRAGAIALRALAAIYACSDDTTDSPERCVRFRNLAQRVLGAA